MPNIEIMKQQPTESGWRFVVIVGGTNFDVELDKDYWQQLTGGFYQPEELIKKSFEFLLSREPKESILKKFHLREIGKYFPEYEAVIKK